MKTLIKEAIELANGWNFNSFDNDLLMIDGLKLAWPVHTYNSSGKWAQPVLDALAAQLVRQIDLLDTPETIEITHNKVWIGYRSKNNESWKQIKGTDRTMNTIKAIVDSGILK